MYNIVDIFFTLAVYSIVNTAHLHVAAVKDAFDVTTIYYVGNTFKNTTKESTVEVHALSNARGLPVSNGEFIIDDSMYERQFPHCQSDECSWDYEGWVWETVNRTFNTDAFVKVSSGVNLVKFLPLHQLLKVKLNGYIYRNEVNVNFFLIPQKTKLLQQLSEFYVIQAIIYDSNYYYSSDYSKVYYCKGLSGSSKTFVDFDGQQISKYCTRLHNFERIPWIQYDSNYLIANITSEKFKIWSDIRQQNSNLDWKPTNPMDIKFLVITVPAKMKVKLLTTGLKPNTKYLLTSPWFTASFNKLCMTIVAQGMGVFNITVETMQFDRYYLGSARTHFEDAIQFTSKIPEEVRGSKIRLIMETVENSSDFIIEKILSCMDKGAVFELNLDDLNAEDRKPVFDVLIDRDVGWCFNNQNAFGLSNGGCELDSLRACPPGFTGYKCETACGRNAFGSDCSRVCSKHTRECQGLQLCTTAFGCGCASGFLGETCEEMCEPGQYGNDCKQTCGHCAQHSPCDIYTGHCQLCEAGYYPPYCKDTYPIVDIPPAVSTTTFGEATVTPFLGYYSGKGEPVMYQVQYRESKRGSNDWIVVDGYEFPKILDTNVEQMYLNPESIIEGLEDGRLYDVRIILVTKHLETYLREDVPFTTFLSLCTVPKEVDYQVTANSNTTAVIINWTYKNTSEHWCPAEHYQVSRMEDLLCITENTTNTYFVVQDLLPDSTIMLKVRAYTSGGIAPFSNITSVATKREAPGPVRNLQASQSDTLLALVSWSPPDNVGSEKINYHLQYQCVERAGCRKECKPGDSQEIVVSSNSETLNSLLPFTQYVITVSAHGGPTTSLKFGTEAIEPTEVVTLSMPPFIATNTSVTVYWTPVDVCSGFFKGYIYQVYKIDEEFKAKMLKEAFTRKPYFSLEQLSPQTEYFAHVFIKTLAGWSSDKYLRINFTTSATVPEQVVNLTVYKRGRHLLGLRWGKPVKLYGELQSFTISYDNTSLTVPPTPCVVWPSLYCYTVENLRPHKKYTVSVAARNKELSQDGTPTSVTAVTRESTPGLPEDFKIVNSTSTTFALSWKYPTLANGIVRSFLLSVEETESFNTEECCQVYPMQEVAVTEELAEYVIGLSGLHPASTYTVSLSAKTVSIGPSLTLTVYTRPPPMLVQLPVVSVNSQEPLTWLKQDIINTSHVYQPLIKGRMLLVVLNESTGPDFPSGIEDKDLKTELKKLIDSDFYLAAEYFDADSITIGSGESEQTKWGTSNNPSLNSGETYRLAAVQVSEYCGVINIDTVFSDMFTVMYDMFSNMNKYD